MIVLCEQVRRGRKEEEKLTRRKVTALPPNDRVNR